MSQLPLDSGDDAAAEDSDEVSEGGLASPDAELEPELDPKESQKPNAH